MPDDLVFEHTPPRPQRREHSWPLILSAGSLAGLLAIGAAALYFMTRVGPSEMIEGQTWDVARLVAYLESVGVRPVFEAADAKTATSDRLLVYRCPSAAEARVAAAKAPVPAFAWGRFVVAGEPAALAQARAALRS